MTDERQAPDDHPDDGARRPRRRSSARPGDPGARTGGRPGGVPGGRHRAAPGDPETVDTDVREEDGTLTVTESVIRPEDAIEAGAVETDRVARPALDGPKPSKAVTWTAIVGGVLGFLLFVLTPFMPVDQSQTSLSWPQRGSMNSVDAPLVAYAPTELEIDVPISLSEQLPEGKGVLVGTMPPSAENATSNGLQVLTRDTGLSVISSDRVLLSLSAEELEANRGGMVIIRSDADTTTVEVPGAVDSEGKPIRTVVDYDARPQVTGVYTDLPSGSDAAAAQAAGLDVQMQIDSRYTSSPTTVKMLVMGAGVVLMVASLWALSRIDRVDGSHRLRWMRRGWWKPTALDGVVALVLVYWHFFGANTSDDGYILTMARAADHAGYMANYYRWFGVPESPFGWPYYDLLALMTHVSSTSVWVRLPATIAALAAWFVISRLVIPRLGKGIAGRRVAYWSAAGVLLAFWLPYNNGLRPEPAIALGALLTWVFIERAIYTRRLLPAAIGVIIATLSLGSGPTGLMAVAALLAGLPALIRIVVQRHRALGGGWAAPVMQIAPFLAAGTMILIGVFGNQTLASVLEAVRVRGVIGPNNGWYQEPIRWYFLMIQTVDGSITRRFAVVMALVALGITIAALLRHRTVPGALAAPATRLVFIFLGTMFFMTFTPTKWTHHFGVYAGIAAALAALAAMAVSHWAVGSRRNQVLFAGTMIFLLSYCLMTINGWWYVSAYGVPWFDKTPQFRGFEFGNLVLFIALAVLGLGAVLTFVDEYRRKRRPSTLARRLRVGSIAASPFAVATFLIVAFSMASLGKAVVDQAPAYSVGMGNIRSLKGETCQLAQDVLMEKDPNAGYLRPEGGDLGRSLNPRDEATGFTPDGLPESMTADPVWADEGAPGTDEEQIESNRMVSDQNAGTEGGFASGENEERARNENANGSTARLPFGLDPKKVPVLGSWREEAQQPSKVVTDWYELPAESEDKPLLVITAAGRIAHHDINGVFQPGQVVMLEFGRNTPEGYQVIGTAEPYDVGPQPVWRNLRFPMDQVPDEAETVRIVTEDNNLAGDEYVVITPPRIPEMATLAETIPESVPTLLDWPVGLQFPCQRPFDHWGGVAETPEYRIMADHPLTVQGPNTWQNDVGGGPLGWSEAITHEVPVPAYQRWDWKRDWGSVSRLVPRENEEGVAPDDAEIVVRTVTRSGWWSPGKMIVTEP
ncbi:arabinosyltransferase domain-containing protein [Corynebacterium sp. 335C]